jgi:methionyl-tRNA synthetase
MPPPTYYITTPIYYVNDRPHIGHCYTTVVADVAARFQTLIGGAERDVFFLTGTDEHAEKVVEAAAKHNLTPHEWADQNAAEFEKAFTLLNCSNDDFIRTSQRRHVEKVLAYMRRLVKAGDVYLGDYEGWFDASQEEYVTESTARESDYKSPVTGRPLEKRREKNYFFALSKYADRLKAHIEASPAFILPEARRNEVLGRIRTGLQDVPISRAVKPGDAAAGSNGADWGILMPDDPSHRIYVWIDALFNYLSAVDTDERRRFWPADVHLIAKDILWFHAVIWPCMLMALGEELPRTVYAHSYWIREGRKMSKSLGNFLDLDQIVGYCDRYSRDALRWFLATQGPLGVTDADFAHSKFIEVFNADLANGIGNATSRMKMIESYFDGRVPDPKGVASLEGHDWPALTAAAVDRAIEKVGRFDIAGALAEGIDLARRVDGYINATEPFRLAKQEDPASRDRLAQILYHCAETLRIATLLLAPAMPDKMAQVWRNWNCHSALTVDGRIEGPPLKELTAWGGPHALKPGQPLARGEVLFARAKPDEPPPASGAAFQGGTTPTRP